jgi:hypothetical protein
MLFAVLLAVPAGLSAQDPPKLPKPTRNPDLITRQEIEAVPEAPTAFEVVSRLRATWLNTARQGSLSLGPGDVVVYVNEVRRGGREALREVDRLQIAEIRRVRGVDATTRFGTDHEHGAILVKLK